MHPSTFTPEPKDAAFAAAFAAIAAFGAPRAGVCVGGGCLSLQWFSGKSLSRQKSRSQKSLPSHAATGLPIVPINELGMTLR